MQTPSEITLKAAERRIIELQLLWSQKEEYGSYQAVIRRVGGSEKFTIPNLHLEKNPGGSLVRLRLPTQHLGRGLCQLSLGGIAGDGTSGPTEEYNFMVGD